MQLLSLYISKYSNSSIGLGSITILVWPLYVMLLVVAKRCATHYAEFVSKFYSARMEVIFCKIFFFSHSFSIIYSLNKYFHIFPWIWNERHEIECSRTFHVGDDLHIMSPNRLFFFSPNLMIYLNIWFRHDP